MILTFAALHFSGQLVWDVHTAQSITTPVFEEPKSLF